MMTATYSPDDNKLRLYSVVRLDADTYARVKSAGFIWAAKQGLFVAPAWTPQREDLLLELCGEIGDEDTSLLDRAEVRADRFDGYQEHRRRDAENAHKAVSSIADNIPLGQPILVGHHSEKRARKDAERIESGMRRAIKMWDTAEYWKSRAAGALAHAKYKERADVRARRIKGLETERRRHERHIAESTKWIKAWGRLTAPTKEYLISPDVYAMGAPRADDETQYRRALAIANYSGISIRVGESSEYVSLWTLLDRRQITPRNAQLRSLKAHARGIAYARRWLVHLDNRLTYEKAMLAEQGASELIAPKARPKQLPLCNYRAPEGITVTNPYQPGPMTLQQVEMTQKEYAEIHTDYKGTRVCANSHRVRTALVRRPGGAYYDRSIFAVFLTDAKTHDIPAPVEKVEDYSLDATVSSANVSGSVRTI